MSLSNAKQEHPRSVAGWLDELTRRGIAVLLREDGVSFVGPQAAITPKERAELGALLPRLEAYLRDRAQCALCRAQLPTDRRYVCESCGSAPTHGGGRK